MAGENGSRPGSTRGKNTSFFMGFFGIHGILGQNLAMKFGGFFRIRKGKHIQNYEVVVLSRHILLKFILDILDIGRAFHPVERMGPQSTSTGVLAGCECNQTSS